MSDIAIRVENLSKLYPELSARAGHIGALQQRNDTLRDALTGLFRRGNQSTHSQSTNPDDTNLWALRDVSFEACPECNRRVKRGEVVGTPALASGASVIGRNGAGTRALARSAGEHLAQDSLPHRRADQQPHDLRSL